MIRAMLRRVDRRKLIRRLMNGKRVYEYLVKWHDWEIYDATWCAVHRTGRYHIETLPREPAKHIPDLEHYRDHFLVAAKEASIEERYRIMLLPSTAVWWDEKGELMRDKLADAGIEPREWWE